MTLMERRRALMGAAKEESINIPIGVELVTGYESTSGYYYGPNENDGSSASGAYRSYLKRGSGYKATLPIPYDTRATFTISGISSTYGLRGLALDEDQNCICWIKSTNAATISDVCKTAEENTGEKVCYVVFSAQSGTPSVIRTA